MVTSCLREAGSGSASLVRKTNSVSDMVLLRDPKARSGMICGKVREEPWTKEGGVWGWRQHFRRKKGLGRGQEVAEGPVQRRTLSTGRGNQGSRGNRGLCSSCP